MEPVDDDALRQPPRNIKDTILSRALVLKTLLSAAVIISGTLFIFWKEVSRVLAASRGRYLWWEPRSWRLAVHQARRTLLAHPPGAWGSGSDQGHTCTGWGWGAVAEGEGEKVEEQAPRRGKETRGP